MGRVEAVGFVGVCGRADGVQFDELRAVAFVFAVDCKELVELTGVPFDVTPSVVSARIRNGLRMQFTAATKRRRTGKT